MPKVEAPQLHLSSLSFVWSLDAPSSRPQSSPPKWISASTGATTNVAFNCHSAAVIFRDVQGFFLGGASYIFNLLALMADVPLIIGKVSDIALLLELEEVYLQWDRGVGSFAARKWASEAALPFPIRNASLISKATNAAARELAKSCSTSSDGLPAVFRSCSLPPIVLAIICEERAPLPRRLQFPSLPHSPDLSPPSAPAPARSSSLHPSGRPS